MNRHELFDEPDIRRALRLDADEMAPRLDPRVIAAAVRATRSSTLSTVAIAAAVAFVAGWAWSAVVGQLLGTLVSSSGFDVLGGLIGAADGALVWLAALAQAASAPAIPIAILVLALMAAFVERRKVMTDAAPF
jgi:hypothetical protein